MIDFRFDGWIRGATINKAFDKDGNEVDVSNLTVYELAHKLDYGELTIDFAPYLSDHVEAEINVAGFVPSRYRPRES